MAQHQTEKTKQTAETTAAFWKNKEPVLPFTAEGLITFYNAMFRQQGFALPPHLYPVAHALMDERIDRLLIIVGPGAGKSLLTSVAFPAFVLGHRPWMTILGVSAGEGLMQGFLKAIMDWIEWSPQWKFFFPNVMPDKNAGWSTERGLYVTGHPYGDPDASLFCAGLSSSVITGKHGRLLILDDIHNRENSATSLQCQIVRKTYYDTLVGRANPAGARFVMTGRRWSEEDIYGHLKGSGQFVTMELPAVRKNTDELFWDVTVPTGLKCIFNEMF